MLYLHSAQMLRTYSLLFTSDLGMFLELLTCEDLVHSHTSSSTDIHKNVINPEENLVKEEILHNKHRELKDKLRSINQGFERLRKVSHQGYDATSGMIQWGFCLFGINLNFKNFKISGQAIRCNRSTWSDHSRRKRYSHPVLFKSQH